MNEPLLYHSGLCQIAYTAALESGKICKNILQETDLLQTSSAMARRRRRLILHHIYTPSKIHNTKRRYHIRLIRRISFPGRHYLYICQKMTNLADRQSKILLLCRIYGIPVKMLSDLFSRQALAFTLIYYHLSHETSSKNDGLYRSILKICQDIIHGAEEFVWSNGRPSDHRTLMRRDIADEFRIISEGICEILGLTLLSNSIKET